MALISPAKMKSYVYGFILVSLTSQLSFGKSPQCVDENGNNVDWFVLYKLPQIYNHRVRLISQGTAYLYITSKTVTPGKWELGNHPITSAESIPGKTLRPIFEKKNKGDVKNYFWVFYNDQPPDVDYQGEEGHTKGIVAGDIKGGFWIIHSVPKFPQIGVESFKYKYPASGRKYGQSFLCISMNAANIELVGKASIKPLLDDFWGRINVPYAHQIAGRQLIVNHAYVFAMLFEGSLKAIYRTLFRAAQNERDQIDNSKQLIESSNRTRFISFAKSKSFKRDIYANWVSDVLRTGLLVSSWLHWTPLPSNCQVPYPVYNTMKVAIDSVPVSFHTLDDHSKYAVSMNEKKPWVCIGDINRAVTQSFRGGGVVCIKKKKLWSAYHGMIKEIAPCLKPKKVGENILPQTNSKRHVLQELNQTKQVKNKG